MRHGRFARPMRVVPTYMDTGGCLPVAPIRETALRPEWIYGAEPVQTKEPWWVRLLRLMFRRPPMPW